MEWVGCIRAMDPTFWICSIYGSQKYTLRPFHGGIQEQVFHEPIENLKECIVIQSTT